MNVLFAKDSSKNTIELTVNTIKDIAEKYGITYEQMKEE